jgi:tetratricopeptide (TPR) repeat protein
MELADIKKARDGRQYEDALKGCCELLKADENNFEALRLRASTYMLMGDLQNALKDHMRLTEATSPAMKDLFLAADTAFALGLYSQGCDWLVNLLKVGVETENDSYQSAAEFLLAYGRMREGRYLEGREALERAVAKEQDIEMPIPGGRGIWSAEGLLKEIDRRDKST